MTRSIRNASACYSQYPKKYNQKQKKREVTLVTNRTLYIKETRLTWLARTRLQIATLSMLLVDDGVWRDNIRCVERRSLAGVV